VTTTAPELSGLSFVQHLGSGGYAEVYLYEQHMPRLKVAVKVLNAGAADHAVLAQFTAEANTMAQLADHPFIVPVMRADVTADGRPFIVMKYFPNPHLGVRARREMFSVADVLRLGIQVTSAVETAHRAGIVHRDIKPANILTGPYGDPGLTDFGIAGTTAVEEQPSSEGGMSVPWSPPEVLFGQSDGDVLTDVYSLGATVWHLLAGRPPYHDPHGDNSQLQMMRRIQSDTVPAVPREDVPESLQRLLRQALAKAPAGRPQSALLFARGLQAVEQELRLPRTTIVLPEVPTEPAPFQLDEDPEARTAVRAARVVRPEPGDEPTIVPSRLPTAPVISPAPVGAAPVDDLEQPTRHRAAVVDPGGAPTARERVLPAGADRTVARLREVAPEPAQPTPTQPAPTVLPGAGAQPASRGATRVIALIAGFLVLLAVVVGAVVVASGGGAKKPDEPSVTDKQDPFAAAAADTPTTPVLRFLSESGTQAWLAVEYEPVRNGDRIRLVYAFPGGRSTSVTKSVVTSDPSGRSSGVRVTTAGVNVPVSWTATRPTTVTVDITSASGAVSSSSEPVAL
jgi:serine/threonine protein kinase